MNDHTHTFARFWKCALQVNTAGYSAAYRGAHHGLSEAEYNAALAARCVEAGIDVVGIADHGGIESIDALRDALRAAGLVVFPGFEIACTEKFHMVCLFAEDTTRDELNRYLGALGLTKPEETAWPSSKGCLEIAREVHKVGGFWYAAHATQKNGILDRSSVHNWVDCEVLRAVQIPGSVQDLPPEFKSIVCNKDPNWRRERPVAVINAKDVAKPEDVTLPTASCWVKMTRPGFDAFKVAFLDPESRVHLVSDKPSEPPGAIHAIRVNGGYLDGVHAVLSGHLDTVIGGRGTGKSTLIECLRYALDLPPKGKQAQRQHLEIIKENLGKDLGRVELDLTSAAQHGKRYRVTRKVGEAPIIRDEQGAVSALHPRDLLPDIDVYGQNEIYELAQDESSRLRLMDRFLPRDRDASSKMEQVNRRLRENASLLTKALDDADQVKAQVGRLPKLQEQLQSYHSLGLQEKLARVPLLARERQLVTRAEEEIQRVRLALSQLEEALPDLTFLSDKALDGLPNRAHLASIREVLNGLLVSLREVLKQAGTRVADSEQLMLGTVSTWRTALDAAQGEIDKALLSLPSAVGRSGQQIGADYQRLQQEIEKIRPQESRMATFDKLVETLEQDRRNRLAELSDLRDAQLRELQSAAKKLNRRLDGRLKIEIVPEGDRSPLKAFLLDCKLEGVGEKRLAWIDERETISPLELARSIKAGAANVQLDWGLTPLVAEALAKLPPSKVMALESLELAHRVRISLNVAHGGATPVFKSLERLSTGQQCTAILHLLLLDNRDPLVMDQPEDNLDNAFIAERIVRELRSAKAQRQFIFATHNANIPVFGDAEWIGVFTATDSRGTLDASQQGSIDVPAIRDSVAIILEGGREAFLQRKAKYEF